MKLILTESPELSEPELEIRYAKMDSQLQSLIKRIKKSGKYLCGEKEGRQYRILEDDIFYIETVDRKTFIKTESALFRSEFKLYQLLESLNNPDFVQVNKSCILNINALDNIKTMTNSRIVGALANGEKIEISRTFIPAIRAAFT